ncbi:MAG: RES family NAD+ phosphorylase [Steroidobacteraceae bacterium]
MSSTTWTRRAVESEAAPLALTVWRAVEAQHVVATRALVDSLAEQALLEQILDAAKPRLPLAAAKLHYLLATPFRYPTLPRGSRFRAPHDPGVFYGADEQRTAFAELGYWRWRFLRDSPALTALEARPQTVFRVGLKTARAIDLRSAPFRKSAATWKDPGNYAGCQRLALHARAARIEVIRYESVRDPLHAGAAAVLAPAAFTAVEPLDSQTWSLAITRTHAIWQRQSANTRAAFEFAFADAA